MANKIQRSGPLVSLRILYAVQQYSNGIDQTITLCALIPQIEVIQAQEVAAQSDQAQHNPATADQQKQADK